jgi:hypothetical protein
MMVLWLLACEVCSCWPMLGGVTTSTLTLLPWVWGLLGLMRGRSQSTWIVCLGLCTNRTDEFLGYFRFIKATMQGWWLILMKSLAIRGISALVIGSRSLFLNSRPVMCVSRLRSWVFLWQVYRCLVQQVLQECLLLSEIYRRLIHLCWPFIWLARMLTRTGWSIHFFEVEISYATGCYGTLLSSCLWLRIRHSFHPLNRSTCIWGISICRCLTLDAYLGIVSTVMTLWLSLNNNRLILSANSAVNSWPQTAQANVGWCLVVGRRTNYWDIVRLFSAVSPRCRT